MHRYLILLLLFLPLSAAAANPEMARVITSGKKPVQCISPISVYNLDGKLVQKSEMGFDLEPGRHTLVGTADLNLNDCPRMRSSRSVDIPALDYVFEAGKTYYIGLQHKSSNQQLWRFVVWRVVE